MTSLAGQSAASHKCPSCGSARVSRRATLPAAEVVKCLDCDLCFAPDAVESGSAEPIETEEAFYRGIMSSFAQQQAVAPKRVGRRLAAYQRWLGRPVTSLLEIGCATGAYASAYTEAGVRYCGVEIDARLAEFARSHGGFEPLNSNFFDVKDVGTFDVIFASQVLEHVQDPAAFLEHAKAIAPSGLIHVDVPNQDSLVSSVRKVVSKTEFGFIQPPHHMIAYNRGALADLFRRCGLRPLLVRPFSNDDPLWGQLVSTPSVLNRLSYALAGAVGRGSLLVGIAAVAPQG